MSRWTSTEIATLVREYALAPRVSALRALIPRHTLAGIYAKARLCGLFRRKAS